MQGRQEVGNRVTADIDHVFSFPRPRRPRRPRLARPPQRMINWTGNLEGKEGEHANKKEPD